ncbi:phage coat protein [Aliivibrio salmonicida]|uniref:phage coat protein n=1 Tax=Aliivibrio salmonicida TaxID=40269 RepID=UPI003D0F4B1A
MKYMNVKKLIVLGSVALASPAFADTNTDSIFGAIDLTTVAASIGGIGVLIVGITMVMKSITLAKRTVNKA